jgi:hypothetical protein
MTHFDRTQIDIHRLEQESARVLGEEKKALQKKIHDKKTEVQKILDLRLGKAPKSFEKEGKRPIPCYFNDGCCGYTNGLTCIEIDRNVIRLIKWQKQDNQRYILEKQDIHILLQHVKVGRPVDDDFQPDEYRTPRA